jgi:tetratricopeptide (TPR) repeat protein
VERHLLVETLTAANCKEPHDAILEGIAIGVINATDHLHLEVATEALHIAVRLAAPSERIEALHEAWFETFTASGPDSLRAVIHAEATSHRNPERAVEALDAATRVAVTHGMFAEGASFQQSTIAILETTASLAASTLRKSPTAPVETMHPEILKRRTDRCEMLRRSGDARGTKELWVIVEESLDALNMTAAVRALGVLCALGESTRSGSLDLELADLVERTFDQCTDDLVAAKARARASLFYSMNNYERCRHHYMLAVEAARRTGDADTLGFVLGFAYHSLTHPLDWPLRERQALELLRLGEQLNDDMLRFEAFHLLFSCQLQNGDPLVRTTQASMGRIADSINAPQYWWMFFYLSAVMLQVDGRFEEAIALSERGTTIAPTDQSRALATHLVQLTACRMAQGRGTELANELNAVALDQPMMRAWLGLAAWPAAQIGDWEQVRLAAHSTDCGHNLPHDMGWIGSVYLLARAIAAWGDLKSTQAIYDLLSPHTNLMVWIGHTTFGPIDLALAELAITLDDRNLALSHAKQARSVCDRLYAPAYRLELDQLDQRLSDESLKCSPEGDRSARSGEVSSRKQTCKG